ncbi:Uncharacterized protein PBTT_03380 [Plasmodiophora brassicae]
MQRIAGIIALVGLGQALTLTADFDTCFQVGNRIRGQFAVEGLGIPEPGDNFVVTVQTVSTATNTPVDAAPAQIFNGQAAQGNPPSFVVGTQAPEVNRVAGFLDFDPAQGVTCNAGKIDVGFRILSYTQNGKPVAINADAPIGAAAPSTAAPASTPAPAPAGQTVAPAPPCPVPQVSAAPPATPAATTANRTATTTTTMFVNADPVTVTYSGQCSNGVNAIQLLVQTSKGGAGFKPDAANPGGNVPCDEYFELSFSFVDNNGQAVNFPVQQNSFFNAKRLVSDGNGNVVAQFTPEINGFGSGFLQLGASGLACTNGLANFKIRTNYLLTALNDGTYNRMLNKVTDAGFFGTGQQAAIPANANTFMLGQPQCNVKTNTFIAFPFPA